MAKLTRYNIKGRLANLGMTNRMMVDELNVHGIKCSEVEFSQAINGAERPKHDLICREAVKILEEKEKQR